MVYGVDYASSHETSLQLSYAWNFCNVKQFFMLDAKKIAVLCRLCIITPPYDEFAAQELEARVFFHHSLILGWRGEDYPPWNAARASRHYE